MSKEAQPRSSSCQNSLPTRSRWWCSRAESRSLSREPRSACAARPRRWDGTAADGRLMLHLAVEKTTVLEVLYDGLSYQAPPLVPSAPEVAGSTTPVAKPGRRVVFTVFDRTTSPAQLSLGAGSHFVCQVGEGAVG